MIKHSMTGSFLETFWKFQVFVALQC